MVVKTTLYRIQSRTPVMSSTHRNTIDLILSAVHNHVGEDGMMYSFLFSTNPGAPAHRQDAGLCQPHHPADDGLQAGVMRGAELAPVARVPSPG